MSLRWRKSGELLCAAKHTAIDSDTYIDDRLHYQLAVIERVAIPDEDEQVTGQWHWKTQDEETNKEKAE